MNNTFGDRLLLAFNGAKQNEIAERLGITSRAVGYYLSGRIPDGEKLQKIAEVTGCNLHWLLTGEGPVKPVSEQTVPHTSAFDELLTERIREIIRQEFAGPVQDLGAVDDFDLKSAVETYSDPNAILNAWIRHEGGEMRAGDGVLFADYEQKTTAEKMAAIIDAKDAIERATKE